MVRRNITQKAGLFTAMSRQLCNLMLSRIAARFSERWICLQQ